MRVLARGRRRDILVLTRVLARGRVILFLLVLFPTPCSLLLLFYSCSCSFVNFVFVFVARWSVGANRLRARVRERR